MALLAVAACGHSHVRSARPNLLAVAPMYGTICLVEEGAARCTGRSSGTAVRGGTIEYWEDQFASGQAPCVRVLGETRCYGGLRVGWERVASPGAGEVLRAVGGNYLLLVRGNELIFRSGGPTGSRERRLVVHGLLDAMDGDPFVVLTPAGLRAVDLEGELRLGRFLGEAPGATRLVNIRAGFVAWTPGVARYYWFHTTAEPAVVHDAPEPLRFVTGHRLSDMFCAIGRSGNVYCADEQNVRCARDVMPATGVLTRRPELGPASTLGVGIEQACAVVSGEGWCWGWNGLDSIGPDYGRCVATPVRLRLPQSEPGADVGPPGEP